MADAAPSSRSGTDRRDSPAPPLLSGRPGVPTLPTGELPLGAAPAVSPMSGAIGPLDTATLAALATGPLPQADAGAAAAPAPRSRREAREAERRSRQGRAPGPVPPAAPPTAASSAPTLPRRRTIAAAAGAAVLGGGLAALVHDRLAAAARLDAAMSAPPTGLRNRAAGAVSRAGARTPAKAPTLAPGTPSGLLALPADLDVEHTLRRFTYGATPALRAEIDTAGVASWLGAQLQPSTVPDPEGDALVRRFPRLGWSVAETVAKIEYKDQWAVMMDLAAAHIGRAMWSRRQLREVMVDFWSNHLNVTNPSDGVWHSRHRFDADVIRRHAFGRFEDMLVASAFHPAMLAYLDAYNSTGDAPNENYARELLELHTVGVDGGYGERDVKQAALLVTGWTLDDGKVGYDPGRHHAGRVEVMGWSHPNPTRRGGKEAVTSLLRYLANHRATARHVARKLAVRFVSDAPPADLVERLATVYLQQKTAIKPVLVALIASPEFAASQGEKMRRPFEAVVAAARAVGVRTGEDTKGLMDLYWMLEGMGHKPLAWPMPNGYPDVAATWQSPATALNQVNVMTAIVHGWWPRALGLPKTSAVFPKGPTSRQGAVDAVARRIFGRAATRREVEALDKLLASAPTMPRRFGRGTWEQEETLALAMTLLLNSPAHLVR